MNNLIKKGKVIGIICLLILVSVPTVVSQDGKPENEALDHKYTVEIYTHVVLSTKREQTHLYMMNGTTEKD